MQSAFYQNVHHRNQCQRVAATLYSLSNRLNVSYDALVRHEEINGTDDYDAIAEVLLEAVNTLSSSCSDLINYPLPIPQNTVSVQVETIKTLPVEDGSLLLEIDQGVICVYQDQAYWMIKPPIKTQG